MHTRRVGMVLPMVLWMIAGLSLMLGNLVQFSRVEVQTTSAHLKRYKSQILYMGVSKYVAKAMSQDERTHQSPPILGNLTINQEDIIFELVNAGGLIDLNYADDAVLEYLFGNLLGWGPDRISVALAERRRLKRPAYSNSADARRGLGISSMQWYRLSPYITLHGRNSGINFLAAPLDVLRLFARKNAESIDAFDKNRGRDKLAVDLSIFPERFHRPLFSDGYRLSVGSVIDGVGVYKYRYWMVKVNGAEQVIRVVETQNL